jgi:hypothetical protein
MKIFKASVNRLSGARMFSTQIQRATTKKQIRDFINIEWSIYKNDRFWVPPLIKERLKILDVWHSPFYHHAEIALFTAARNGIYCGRIAAIKNDLHNEFHKDKVGFFGFFESIDDQEVADLLFDSARDWLKQNGFNVMRGPANPSSNEEFGLLVDGFEDSPRFLMTYNFPYYIKLIESYGFQKAKDLYAYKMEYAKVISSKKLERVAEAAKERSQIKIVPIDMKNYNRFIDKIKYVYNKAWQTNWGYVPMTDEEIDLMAKDIKPLIEPSGVLFGEINGETVGFTLAVLDYNQLIKKFNGKLYPFNLLKLFMQRKKINWGRIITLGIVPEFQKRGLDAVFYWELVKRGHDFGIDFGEASWILEDNDLMNRAIRVMGGELYKTYRIYDFDI